MDELIQQSQWNLQQQEQHLLALRQVWGPLLLSPPTPSALSRPRALPFPLFVLRWSLELTPVPQFLHLYIGTHK